MDGYVGKFKHCKYLILHMDLSDIAHHALWGLAGPGAWKQMKRSPAVASGLVFEMIRMMAIQDCHSTHFDALYRHSKWWLARASRHVCLAFLFGLTKATGGIWQAAWSGQMDFPTSKWISLKYMYVLYVYIYTYICTRTYIFLSQPFWVNMFSQTPKDHGSGFNQRTSGCKWRICSTWRVPLQKNT